MSLIEKLRAAHGRPITEAHDSSDFLAPSKRYAALRQEFENRTGRCAGVPRSLNSTKRRECSILFAFLLEYSRLPVHRIMLGESPDFRFSVGTRRIGMEMIDAFVPHPAQVPGEKNRGNIWKEQENIQDEIVRQAMEIHARDGGSPLRVRVSYATTSFHKRDVPGVARELAKLVPKTASAGEFIQSKERWVDLIQVSPRPKCVRDIPRWDVGHSGFMHSGEAVLPAVIYGKEEKLKHYRNARCDEYWLLIYVEGTARSSFIELTDRYSIFTSKFDQIFFFSPHAEREKRVVRLNVPKKHVVM